MWVKCYGQIPGMELPGPGGWVDQHKTVEVVQSPEKRRMLAPPGPFGGLDEYAQNS